MYSIILAWLQVKTTEIDTNAAGGVVFCHQRFMRRRIFMSITLKKERFLSLSFFHLPFDDSQGLIKDSYHHSVSFPSALTAAAETTAVLDDTTNKKKKKHHRNHEIQYGDSKESMRSIQTTSVTQMPFLVKRRRRLSHVILMLFCVDERVKYFSRMQSRMRVIEASIFLSASTSKQLEFD